MENVDLIKKAIYLAESGKGRRLLNFLNKRDTVLTSLEMDKVLEVYREIGLPREVEMLKQRRGILRDDQYDALAKKVRETCSSVMYDDFEASLRTLLSCGIKMNPTKMDV
jgi:hypothetical protein